jgi:hypothetical protein
MDENTKVFLIAPSERQVEDIMFPEISRLYNRANMRGFSLPGRLVGLGIRTEFKEWFMAGFKADSHSVVAWTGLHAANIMFVVTEASGLPQLVFDGIEGNLHGNYRFVLAFNDNTGIGYASNTQKRKDWNKFTLNCLHAPNVVNYIRVLSGEIAEEEYKRNKIPGQVDWHGVNDKVSNWCEVISPSDFIAEEGDFHWQNEDGNFCYRPNDLFRVKVLGLSPKEASGALIPKAWMEAANARWVELRRARHIPGEALRLGVDVAGMGRDSSSFCPRYGNFVDTFRMIQSGGTANHMEIVGIIHNEIRSKTIKANGIFPKAFLDTIGEGAGCYSRLIEMNVPGVFSVKGSASATTESDEPLTDSLTGVYQFFNLRAYLHWAVRDWLNPASKTGAAIPPDDELFEEATSIQWKFRSDGKIEIEKKDGVNGLKSRLKRSPDKWDSLTLTFFPDSPDDFNYESLNDIV